MNKSNERKKDIIMTMTAQDINDRVATIIHDTNITNIRWSESELLKLFKEGYMPRYKENEIIEKISSLLQDEGMVRWEADFLQDCFSIALTANGIERADDYTETERNRIIMSICRTLNPSDQKTLW